MQLTTFLRPLQTGGTHRHSFSATNLGVRRSIHQFLSSRIYPSWRNRSPRRTQWTDGWNRRKSAFAALSTDNSPIITLFFSNVPVEPTFSAAGVRSRYLLTQLLQDPAVVAVHVISPSVAPTPGAVVSDVASRAETTENKTTTMDKFRYHTLAPNHTSAALELLKKICQPAVNRNVAILALFDRYFSEEMFSFHLHNLFPDNVVFVLDMQDMHSLRRTRQNWVQENDDDGDELRHSIPVAAKVAPTIQDNLLLRELACIHRCDLTLVCSPFEYDLLVQRYQIPRGKLCVAPLFGGGDWSTKSLLSFAERRDFVFVGGVKHLPNVDALRQLKRLWPSIRKLCQSSQEPQLPSLYFYGAHCSSHLRTELHDPKNGFHIQGYVSCAIDEVLCDKRVMLSPLRFGAGIKGKHVDAWRCGVPVVTTSIGSEGMLMHDDVGGGFGGRIANTDRDFIHAAETLYNDEPSWTEAAVNITPRRLFKLCSDWERIRARMLYVVHGKTERRSRDVFQKILWHQTNRSTEYFSKYIEFKDEKKLPPVKE
jgi:O-antigen biosynthesis protein